VNKGVYFENLDALRFIAALTVMGEHITRSFYFPEDLLKRLFIVAISLDGSGGELGVIFFFVLSGFLITHLLLSEFVQTESIRLSTFYLRRTLRIWPLYFFVLLIGFVIQPMLNSNLIEKANWEMYAVFLANFDNIYFQWPQTEILGVQWSLAVEEQFYVLWPLLIVFLIPRMRIFLLITVLVILVSLFYRLNEGHKYHTLSCSSPLLIGALLAYTSIYQKGVLEKFIKTFSKPKTVAIYIFMMLVVFFNYRISKYFGLQDLIQVFLFPIFSVFVLIDQNFSPHSFIKLGKINFITSAGKMSYGIYLLHMVAIDIAVYLFKVRCLSFWFSILSIPLLTIGFVILCYYLIERPFLKLRPR
jgi:peptidoglycan/LPS O-acetylase OafA/YrhL